MIWDDTRLVAFDFETSGTLPEYALQPWRIATGDFWATSLSLVRHDGQALVAEYSQILVETGISPPRECIDAKAYIRRVVERIIAEGWIVIGWNIPFDISVLIAYGCGDLVHQIRWLDAMLWLKHLEIEPEYELDRSKKRSFGLKAAVAEFIPVAAGYEDEVDFHSTDPAELAKLQKYNDRDSIFTWVLARMFWNRMHPRQRTAALIEAECLSMIAQANYDGMLIDTLAAHELTSHLDTTASELLEKLAPHGVTEKVVRSPIQLAKLLYDEWGLPVLKENTGKKTGKVSRATDKEVLHELAFADDRCRDLRGYREALNNRTKFADAPLASADYNSDGRSRPSAIVFGTYSGRLTYASKQGKNKDERQTGFALHQEKRDKLYRSIVTAPPGYTLMEFDASGQEFRWMAVLSGDPTMLALCMPGEDPHSYMGGRIAGIDYDEIRRLVKELDAEAANARQLGKVANLSLQYRTYPKTLRKVARVQFNIPLEIPEAQRIHRTYQQTYKRVPEYWERQVRRTKQLGYVETLAGRRVQVRGNWDGPLGWSMESTSLNYPVQGTGADQKYLALKVLKPYLLSVGAMFAWDLHDGIYMWVPDDMVARVAVEAKALLDNLPYEQEWGFKPPIPLPWDCKAGGSWGSLKEWK